MLSCCFVALLIKAGSICYLLLTSLGNAEFYYAWYEEHVLYVFCLRSPCHLFFVVDGCRYYWVDVSVSDDFFSFHMLLLLRYYSMY